MKQLAVAYWQRRHTKGKAMLLAPVNNEKFKYEHLIATPQNLEEIKSFTVARPTGRGLEYYLKVAAEQEEYSHTNRIYLVRDKATNEIAAYFTARKLVYTQRAEPE